VLKIVGDYMTKQEALYEGQSINGPQKAISSIHPLPIEKPDFSWRMRVDLRQGINIPMSGIETQPATYVEFGWSLYENSRPDDLYKVQSVLVENTQYPDFNQTLLFHCPAGSVDTSGYFWVQIKDKNRQDDPLVGEFKFKVDGFIVF
jgi:hypothetical protein